MLTYQIPASLQSFFETLVTEKNQVYPLRGIGTLSYYCTTTLYPLRGKFSVGDLVL
jgi:hypothetical protein